MYEPCPVRVQPQLRIEGRSAPYINNDTRTWATGIRWELTADADESKGGFIFQRVRTYWGKTLKEDYWELWRVPAGSRTPVRPRTVAELVRGIQGLNNPIHRDVIGSLADEHGLLDDVFSKTFPTIIDKKPVTNMTIKMQGDAWYVDGIDVNDLPKVRKQHIFRVRPGQQAGTLLSAQSNPFLNRIHNYLRGKEKVRRCSLKTTQLIT